MEFSGLGPSLCTAADSGKILAAAEAGKKQGAFPYIRDVFCYHQLCDL